MLLILVCAIAGCGAVVLIGEGQPSPARGGVVSAPGRVETFCARLNQVLRKAAVALAMLVVVLSSGQGRRWEARLAAHPEWFLPSVDPETGIGIAAFNGDAVAAQCRTWVYTCRCMHGLPPPTTDDVGTNCIPAGE
jgi:hypothetical protein